jgi:hypothetical protein
MQSESDYKKRVYKVPSKHVEVEVFPKPEPPYFRDAPSSTQLAKEQYGKFIKELAEKQKENENK